MIKVKYSSQSTIQREPGNTFVSLTILIGCFELYLPMVILILLMAFTFYLVPKYNNFKGCCIGLCGVIFLRLIGVVDVFKTEKLCSICNYLHLLVLY